MALADNVAMRLAYKAHTTTTIDPAVDPTLSSNPGATSAQELRRITSTLGLGKSSFVSQEVTAHRQIASLAHGGKRVGGSISGELSPKTYQDFMAALQRGAWAAAIAKTNTEFTSVAADSTARTFTVGGSTWAAQGYRVGDVVRFTNLSEALNNSRNYLITALATTVATVYPAPTTMAADSAFNVTSVGRKVFTPESALTATLFAIEHYYADVDLAHVFSECAIGSMRVSMPAEGIAGVEFGVMGRNLTTYATGSSPFFTSPTAAVDSNVLTTIGGRLTLGGTTQAVVTGAELSVDIGVSPATVAFTNLIAALFTSRQNVSGSLTMFFENNTQLDNFINETELELSLMLTDDSSADADFISLFMPRIKLAGAQLGSAIEGGVPITLPFQALKKATATGYDATTLVIRDSLSA